MSRTLLRGLMSRTMRARVPRITRAISTSNVCREEESESPLQWDMLNSCFVENGSAGFLFPYFVSTEMKLTNESLRSIFDRIDTNGDGVLQREEIMNGFKANGITFRAETVDALMKLADKNNDGVIQYEEFEAMMENLWKTHNVVGSVLSIYLILSSHEKNAILHLNLYTQDPSNVGNW